MKAARLPPEQPHRTPAPIGRVRQQTHRLPEPDCSRRSSLPDTPETASPARDQSPQRTASSDPPQVGSESYPANQIIQCVFTQPGSKGWDFFKKKPNEIKTES